MSEKRLGERVKAARLVQGMTMAELATACGLTKGFISQVESGASDPSLNTLRKIGDALKVPVSYFLAAPEASSSAERVLMDEPRPMSLHEAYGSSGQPGVTPLSSVPDGVHSLATVPPGSRLVHRATSAVGATHATAIVVVLAGKIKLVQDQEDLELLRGGVASWDASAGYWIEAAGLSDASLVLFTPHACSVPVYQAARAATRSTNARHVLSPVWVHSGAAPDRRRGISVGIHGSRSDSRGAEKVAGPLRLVAMRAERLAERRGQS